MNRISDLVLEAREMIDERRTGRLEAENKLPDGVFADTEEQAHSRITRIRIESPEAAAALEKKEGSYVTIELKEQEELNNLDTHKEVAAALAEELSPFLARTRKTDPCVMVVGLGNRNITPDSLGPRVVDKMVVTRHIKLSEELRARADPRLGTVCAVAPGVMGVTGIETGAILKGMIQIADPDLVIAVDALASRKTSRVNTTIQISDTGIIPGSGVGNRRMELSRESLGIPVLAIGVPTVVDAATLARDLLDAAATAEKPDEDLLENLSKTYGSDMVVTPKNIDIAMDRMSVALANGLNMALHHGFDFEEINEYLM